MTGILPLTFDFFKRPQGHGYTIFKVELENPYFEVGTEVRGHEFHYSKLSHWSGDENDLVFQMQQLVTFDDNRAQASGFSALGAELIRLGQESGEIRADLPPEMLGDLFTVSFIAMVKQFYLRGEEFDGRRTIALCVDTFLNGVQPEGEA